MRSDLSASAHFRSLADRNRKHRPKRATHFLEFPRFCRLLLDVWVDVDLMRDLGTCVDGLVRWNGDHVTDAAHTTADASRQRPSSLIMIGVTRVVVISTRMI